MKSFFRKVAFGLKPGEKAPSDPLTWAQKQVETIPELNWKGKHIYSEKEMRKYWITQRVEEDRTLRKKYKNDPQGLRRAEKQLENDSGSFLYFFLKTLSSVTLCLIQCFLISFSE